MLDVVVRARTSQRSARTLCPRIPVIFPVSTEIGNSTLHRHDAEIDSRKWLLTARTAARVVVRGRGIRPHFAGLTDVVLLSRAEVRIPLAGGPGFEPRLTGSEPVVLPLNYPPAGSRKRAGGWI